jgi:hypothetical protein
MNQFDAYSASTAADKLRTPTSSSMQQMHARDAMLAAALQENRYHAAAANFQATQGMFNPHGAGHQGLSLSSLLDGSWGMVSGSAGQHFNSSMHQGAGAHSAALSLTSDPRMLNVAVQRRRMDYERVQAIRQQALALTEDNPFQTSNVQTQTLRALLQRELQQQHPPVITPGQHFNPDGTFTALGSSMRKKNSPYIDASHMIDPDPTDLARRRTRGGVTEPFPEKLHRMLREVEEEGEGDIISFFSHGRAFAVHDSDRFVSHVMPKYFKQSRLSSFQRQLNLYGFTRISSGPDTGGYYHELFLMGRPALCVHMRRVGVPQGEDRRKLKSGAKKQEPDFYSMNTVVNTNQQL